MTIARTIAAVVIFFLVAFIGAFTAPTPAEVKSYMESEAYQISKANAYKEAAEKAKWGL